MSYLVCLFIAPESDAAAIRSTATSTARQRAEWPHLVVPGVDGPDMNKLEKLARSKRPKGSSRLGGKLLDKSKLTAEPFTAVSTVTPEFLHALLALDDAGLVALGTAWATAVDIGEATAVQTVCHMADFARQAAAAGLPVLELVVM